MIADTGCHYGKFDWPVQLALKIYYVETKYLTAFVAQILHWDDIYNLIARRFFSFIQDRCTIMQRNVFMKDASYIP